MGIMQVAVRSESVVFKYQKGEEVIEIQAFYFYRLKQIEKRAGREKY